MPDTSVIAPASFVISVVMLAVLLVLLFRPARPVSDPAILNLQAAQERQAERIAELGGTLNTAVARAAEETGRTISGFTGEQTKVLNEAIAQQRARLDSMEKALLDRLAENANAAALRFEDHRTAQANAATALRQDVTGAFSAAKLEGTEAEGRLRKAIVDEMAAARDLIDRKAKESRDEIDLKLKDMRESNDARLAAIQTTVNEQLHAAVEKQMTESFNRVVDQFNTVQKAMGEVAAVTGQIGDLKRLFSNVKARGGWGEAQCKAVLEDIIPGGYVENFRPQETSAAIVEFAIVMPSRTGQSLHLPLDAKFPIEDYERLLQAADSGDVEGERTARRALGERVKQQAQDIAEKYICEPVTTDFAVLYLPSDSLYSEVARAAGLLAEIGRNHKVLVLGPSLLPALLRTIQLGHYSIALSRNAEAVRELLGATKTEIHKMGDVLSKLDRQASTFGKTIGKALQRTRVIGSKLKGVDAATFERSEQVLEVEADDVVEAGAGE